jgi:hypothetical protein
VTSARTSDSSKPLHSHRCDTIDQGYHYITVSQMCHRYQVYYAIGNIVEESDFACNCLRYHMRTRVGRAGAPGRPGRGAPKSGGALQKVRGRSFRSQTHSTRDQCEDSYQSHQNFWRTSLPLCQFCSTCQFILYKYITSFTVGPPPLLFFRFFFPS